MAIYRGPSGSGNEVNDAISAKDAAIDAQLAAEAAQAGAELAETNAEAAATSVAGLVPSQTGNSGKYLTTNGTITSWNNLAINTSAYSSVPVATDDVALIYDSSGTTTAKCLTSDIAGLGLGSIGYRTGHYYYPYGVNGQTSTGTLLSQRIYYLPFFVRTKTTFNRIGIEIPSGAAGGTSASLGIYNASNGLPTSLLLDAGTISTATSGEKEVTISQELNTGFYFLAFVADSAIGVRTLSTVLGFAIGQVSRIAANYAYSKDNGSITLPASETTTGLASVGGTLPAVTLRIV